MNNTPVEDGKRKAVPNGEDLVVMEGRKRLRDDETEGDNDEDKKPAAVVIKQEKKSSAPSTFADTEVEEIQSPSVAMMPTAVTPSQGSEDGDEVQLLGSAGPNALADFPHAREHCVVHPMKEGPNQFCPNCYCYVCDKQASSCQQWLTEQHSHATSKEVKWRQARAQKKSSAASASSSSTMPYHHYYYTAKELLGAVTRIYPDEVVPPQPPFVTELKHYQKQSLAFMLHVEKNETIKSGWLCTEVGMGKSAIVISLVASNPMPVAEEPTLEQVREARYTKGQGLLDVKATVLLTSVTLMGQWEDEIRKHAPELVVFRHHPPSGYKLKLVDLFDADIVVSTATIKWADVFSTSYQFRRIVLDEAHLLGTTSARLAFANSLVAQRHWCVTATPFSSSTKELNNQRSFLSLPASVYQTPESLKCHMIRHVKSQRIGGSEALALPKSTTTVKTLTMSLSERETCENLRYRYNIYGSRRISTVHLKWYTPLAVSLISYESTKIKALRSELKSLLEHDPNMRACVFTQFLDQQECVKKLVKDMSLKVYLFHGGTDIKYREKYIREFQSLAHPGPAVFIITYRAGSVGITLTAATHVFLMEPCILPSMEVQAAGRIHRLSQTKPVGVTKFVYEDSFESRILELHQGIEQGEQYIIDDGCLRSDGVRVLDPPYWG